MKYLIHSLLLYISFTITLARGATKQETSIHGFIENKGQITDQNFQPNFAVKYLFLSNGLNVQLKASSFSYDTYSMESLPANGSQTNHSNAKFGKEEVTGSYHFHRVDIEFSGANNSPSILAEQVSSDYLNYYTSSSPESGILNVKCYQKVTYKDLYDGIDLQFIVDENNKVKFNFIVHPGANASQIKWKYNGAIESKLKNGQIILTVEQGTLKEKIPSSYLAESTQKINVQYAFSKSDLFSFLVPDYDKNTTLIIDPSPWATYYGGTGADYGYGVKVDVSGNVLVTGQTGSSTNIATSGAHQTVLSAITDAFIVKTNSAGVRQWATYYGGDDYDNGYGITSDSLGNIFITGYTSSTNAIATSGSFKPVTTGGSFGEAFIAKFNPSGVRQWGTYFGSIGDEWGYSVAIGVGGFVIATGFTTSLSSIASSGAHQTTYGGGASDAFVIKLSTTGLRQWSTYYGGNGEDIAYGVSTDNSGNIYLAGSTVSINGIASFNAHDTTLNGISDAFLVKFNPAGQRQWGTYYGGRFDDIAQGLTCDIYDNVFITGNTKSDTAIATVGAHQTTLNGSNFNAFMVKFNTLGQRQWGTYYGGLDYTIAHDITRNPIGDIFITGVTSATSGITTVGTYQPGIGGIQDAFLTKFNTNGVIQWGTYFGGTLFEVGYGVSTGTDGNIVICGSTTSTANISKPGAIQANYGGSTDAFVASFTSFGGLVGITNNTFTGTQSVCKGATPVTLSGSIPIGGNGTYKYKWQYSNLSATSGFTNAGGNDSAQNYSPTTISKNTWFRRAVFSGGSNDTSIALLVSIISNPAFTVNKPLQCLNGNNFVFTDSSTASIGSINYRKWNFGNGIADTSNASSPSKTYTSLGTYNVSLVIGTSGGCFDTARISVNILQQPNAGFTINKISQCLNGNSFIVNDTSTISSGTLTRLWNFGTSQNDTSSLISFNKQYVSMGLYPIKLIVTNQGCVDSVINSVSVNPKPNAGFTLNNNVQCINGNNFLFNDTSSISSGNLNRKWSFSNDITDTSSAVSPSKSYISPNTYNVKLVITSNNNCSDSVSKTLIVHPYPVVGFNINNNVQCLAGNNFLFSDTSSVSTGTFTRKWNFGSGVNDTSGSANPLKIYNVSGTYQVKIMIANAACKDSVVKTVSVHPKPNVGFTINNPVQCLNGNTFLFNDTSSINSGSLQRLWSFNNGDTSNIQNLSKTFAIAAIYSCKLVLTSNNGCKDSMSKTITVNLNPSAGFTINNVAQCLGINNFVFSDTSKITTGNLSRKWNFGSGVTDTSSSTTTTKKYNSANTYLVTLNSISNNNCKDSVSKTVTVYAQPKAGFTQNNLSQCFIGNRFFFDDSSSTNINRLWSLGDLTTNTSDTFSKSYTNAGAYNVKLKITDANNCMDSVIKEITVKPNPVQPKITALSNSLLQSTSANAYQWFLNNNIINGANSQTLVLAQNGNYAVKIDSTNACSNTSNPFSVSSVGLDEIKSLQEIVVYPNPFQNELKIVLNNGADLVVKISIFDLSGKLFFELNANLQKNVPYTISDKLNLKSGLYFIKTETNKDVKLLKFLRE